jgi:hypothetical protein
LKKDKGMRIVICPGIHNPELTRSFLRGMQSSVEEDVGKWLVFPSDRYPAYSGWHIGQFLRDRLWIPGAESEQQPTIAIIAFSAGVVGGIAAAHGWQTSGGKVSGLIALDGWGVPLVGSFPMSRLSHDYFTHWSSALLGGGQDSFYAEPDVEHLDLWRSPQTARGYAISPNVQPICTTAAQFIASTLHRSLHFALK